MSASTDLLLTTYEISNCAEDKQEPWMQSMLLWKPPLTILEFFPAVYYYFFLLMNPNPLLVGNFFMGTASTSAVPFYGYNNCGLTIYEL